MFDAAKSKYHPFWTFVDDGLVNNKHHNFKTLFNRLL